MLRRKSTVELLSFFDHMLKYDETIPCSALSTGIIVPLFVLNIHFQQKIDKHWLYLFSRTLTALKVVIAMDLLQKSYYTEQCAWCAG